MVAEEPGGGCLLEILMAFIIASIGAFTGFSVSIPPPVDEGITTVYTLVADASADEMAIAQQVLVRRLENLLDAGQISNYGMLGLTPDNEIQVSVTSSVLDPSTLITALTRRGRLELVDLTGIATDGSLEGMAISALFEGDIPVLLTNKDIAAATVDEDGFGGFVISIEFTDGAAEILGLFTEAHIGQRLAIVADDVILSAPTIQSRVDSSAVITGDFTEAQAQALASQVGTAPLLVPLELVSVD